MPRLSVSRLAQRLVGAASLLLIVTVLPKSAAAGSSTGPDVTVIYLGEFESGLENHGSVGGVRAYSVGTTSCNVGTQPVAWCDNGGGCGAGTTSADHPVIAGNVYRLKNGRFQQLGKSWLKHGFLSTNTFDSACGSCQTPPLGGSQLGLGCTDTYGSGLNGSRPLGLRSEVNGSTGVFPFPYTSVGTSTAIQQRIQIAEADLDPALNAGARYWVEGHYVTEDDALAGNGFNNASHREISVSMPGFNLEFTQAPESSTVREQPALFAWQAVDSAVELTAVDLDGTPIERFHVARKVTNPSAGVWHYEYVVHNLNSDRSAQSLTLDFPNGVTISAAGMSDVNAHSGEPYSTTDWPATIDGPSSTISWASETFATNANANAIRWGTAYSFWFDANAPPTGLVHTLGLFKPGSPATQTFSFGGAIFDDGFETGNTSAWSTIVP
jgi:hypothetical protein